MWSLNETHQIPPDGFAVSCPPSHYSDDKTITTFAGRFDDVVLVRHPKQ